MPLLAASTPRGEGDPRFLPCTLPRFPGEPGRVELHTRDGDNSTCRPASVRGPQARTGS